MLQVATRDEGDCYARFGLLLDQVKVSLDLAEACLDRLRSLRPGPVNVRLPKILKAPEGRDVLPGPRTRSASTATTWSPAARRPRGG